MYIEVNGQQTFVATGGKTFDARLPTVVLLHGSGLDHRCWALQARWFAFHGFSVFAPDLPGHSLSQGEALTSIEAMGAWLVDALDAAGIEQVHLMGHSQGFLMALEAAPILGDRLLSMMALATAAAIPVNPALIDTAKQNTSKAADMMLQWGFGSNHQYGISAVPGMQPIGIGQRIMANNPLAVDLQACNQYQAGNERAQALRCPVHLVLAKQDRMTPVREGLKLAKLLGISPTVIPNTGHMLPIEAPKESLQTMKSFIQTLN
ncbi:MAG: alpha/beta hydrolase [Gammaproteobacteria bacterium]|nr:alpha/beta hydrolase [Gammaproteobacteria bacterium]MCP4880519.1 alpha/beta hydrolase [Gammaproteobacteria bacterium]